MLLFVIETVLIAVELPVSKKIPKPDPFPFWLKIAELLTLPEVDR
jgi:hypothetical protein